MITQAQQNAMNLYAGMMEEVKMRINSIEYATSGLLNFHPVIIREFSYLQLRMICELVALGCLVAHGDIPATKSKTLSKAWQADEILNALERLHPDFYPHPVKQIRHPTHHELQAIESGFLTRKELLILNGKCGDVIHRGNLRKLLAGPISAQKGHPDVRDWLNKIKALLDSHRIALIGGQSHFVCVLSAQLAGGAVQVAFAEAALPPSELLRSVGRDDRAK
jgi:hypothetical protein